MADQVPFMHRPTGGQTRLAAAVNYNSVLVIPAKWTVERMSQQASYLSELEVGRFPERGSCDLRLFWHVAQKYDIKACQNDSHFAT